MRCCRCSMSLSPLLCFLSCYKVSLGRNQLNRIMSCGIEFILSLQKFTVLERVTVLPPRQMHVNVLCGVTIVLNSPQNELSISITDFPSQNGEKKAWKERTRVRERHSHTERRRDHTHARIESIRIVALFLKLLRFFWCVYVAFPLGIALKLI